MAEQTGKLEPEIGEQVFGGGRYGSGLLDALRSAGLAIGQREHVAVGALIADLIATSEGTIALADLGSHLAPLLARSPQERETFFRVFDALAPTWRTGDLEGERQVPKPQRATLQRRRVNVRAIILGVIAAVGLGAFAIIAPQYFQTAEPPTTQPSVSDVLEANGPRETPTSQPQSEDMARLNRVQDAAAEFFNAPTLEELGRELAATSPIGWSTDAYAQRLHELTGMPRRVPIEVEPDVTFDPILMAVDLIERPGLETDPRVRYSVHEIGFSARAESLREAEQAAFLDAEEARVSEETRGVLRLNGVTASDLQGPPSEVAPANLPLDPAFARRVEEVARRIEEARRIQAATAATVAAELSQTLPADQDLPDEKAGALTRAQQILGSEVPLDLIERALAVSNDPRVQRVWPDAPWLPQTPPPNAAFAPWWALALAIALPLLAGIAWLAYTLRHKKAFLRRRRPEFPPLHMDLLAEAATQIKINAALFQRAAQRLARRTPRDTDRLDIERTVAATIQDGGLMLKPVFARTRTAPDYLVLIEKRAAGDHDYERLRAMALRLSDLVSLDIYSYQTEPSLLETDRGGRFEPIDRVAAKHPDHRLLVLGSGEGFLDQRARKPVASAEKLMRWERRALLTPMPLSEWAQEEMNLARELEMPIGRATPEGIAALAELLGLEGAQDEDLLKPIGDGRARSLPDILRLRGNEFLYDSPPDTHPIQQVVQDLRNYLDDAGFEWLCALAVYPTIQWDLTLYLGVALPEQVGGDAKTTPLYAEDRLAALTQLPWFREGEIPNWLRRALIQQMSKARETEVRAAIHRLLESAQPRGTQAENDQIWFRIGEEPSKEARSPEELFEDEVLLDFMARGALEDFDYSRAAPQRKSRLQFSWLHATGLSVAAVYSAAAFIVAPKPWEGALITGAWLPLALLVIGAGLALAATNVAASYAVVRSLLERIAPSALVFAGFMITDYVFGVLSRTHGVLDWPTAFDAVAQSLGLLISAISAVFAARWLGVYPQWAFHPIRNWRVSLVSILVPLAIAGFIGQLSMRSLDDIVTPWYRWSAIFGACAGLTLFALGVIAARYAPEKLAPPKTKFPLGAKPNRWTEARLAWLVLAGALPALALAWRLDEAHVHVPPVQTEAQAQIERILATSSDGRFFATGGADGMVRVFDAANPRRQLVTFAAQGDNVCQSQSSAECDPPVFMPQTTQGPVISIAIQNLADGRLIVAAATRNGTVKLFDGRSGSLVQDSNLRSSGLRPLIALGADGSWAVAHQDQRGASVLTTNAVATAIPEGGPVLALAAGRDARSWVLALSDGRLVLKVAGSLGFATPDVRLPGRARSIAVVGSTVRATGDDGSVLEADIAGADLANAGFLPADPLLTNARLLPADSRLALGPAVGWRGTSAATPPHGFP